MIAKVQTIKAIEVNNNKQDIADALSENDLQGKKFLKLANDLKERSLFNAV